MKCTSKNVKASRPQKSKEWLKGLLSATQRLFKTLEEFENFH
jgi:hypothetical protein